MVAKGQPVGCYRFVTYPVDAKFEALLFAFFVDEVGRKDSIGAQFFQDVVSKQGTDTGWHRRGERALAQGPVLKHGGGFFSRTKFDSAQLLSTFFLPSAATQNMPVTSRFALMVGASRSSLTSWRTRASRRPRVSRVRWTRSPRCSPWSWASSPRRPTGAGGPGAGFRNGH